MADRTPYLNGDGARPVLTTYTPGSAARDAKPLSSNPAEQPNRNEVATSPSAADGSNNEVVGKTATGSLTTPGKIVGDLDPVVYVPEADGFK
ncbi:hypothetical protein HDU87_005587 [Geranomyces variabilis]|uniref:Uncharacterized protein n=1 Tax=Geranomyces variabilis TaxID=109894 RepID=A0AAD5TJ27_9FUNG|nr:hypothetical protein HDU87_005587 [Geranomyces variabilis]